MSEKIVRICFNVPASKCRPLIDLIVGEEYISGLSGTFYSDDPDVYQTMIDELQIDEPQEDQPNLMPAVKTQYSKKKKYFDPSGRSITENLLELFSSCPDGYSLIEIQKIFTEKGHNYADNTIANRIGQLVTTKILIRMTNGKVCLNPKESTSQ